MSIPTLQGLSSFASAMRNPFFSTRTASSSRVLPDIPFVAALAFVQDPHALITLNPLVVDYNASPVDPTLYTITDRLPLLGGCWHMRSVYTARFEKVEGGTKWEIRAGMGTVGRNETVVREVEGGTEVVETVKVKAFSFLMPYIMSQMNSSHAQMFDSIHEKLKARLAPESETTPAPKSET